MMKKLFSIIVILGVLMSVLPASAAQGEFQIVVPTQTAKPGETVMLDLCLENNTGILAMLFDVTYDQARLELVAAQDMGLVEGALFSQSVNTYPYKLVYNSASFNNFTKDGVLARLTFKVKETASGGNAFVALGYDPENVYDVDMVNVDLGVVNGGIDVDAPMAPEPEPPVPSAPATPSKPSASSAPSRPSAPSKPSSTGSASAAGEKEEPKQDLTKKQVVLTIGQTAATVFGEQKENDVAPKIVNDRTMLPARFVAESLGATVLWTADEPKKVEIQKEGIQIVLYIDSDKAYVNGNEVILDSVAFLENDRTYTPVRFIAEALGAKVDWDEATQKVSITVQ